MIILLLGAGVAVALLLAGPAVACSPLDIEFADVKDVAARRAEPPPAVKPVGHRPYAAAATPASREPAHALGACLLTPCQWEKAQSSRDCKPEDNSARV